MDQYSYCCGVPYCRLTIGKYIFVSIRDIYNWTEIHKIFQGTSYPMTLFYDVYIACNEEDEKIRLWVTTHLLPTLEENNMLRVFWPCRDSEIGVPREEEMINVMSHTQTFVIILSEEYKGLIRWNEKEWKHAWHNYTRDLNREIIIINYDLLEANEIAKRYLGAFLRIGQFIDFSNQKKSIENEVASFNKTR
ncbi:Hypothetical predicted protein [Mytilus galloprovincialis]|uniref:TIR domain-containing protein n=1 Tax=Mytilus galloprovincialis TaxID=29158 RepID=A0A8B6EEV1_MYTGA|nr:Hypothetical predicted protein [Mytilus galloprovincialis]